jgi:SAM-dependent methyltransferase
MSDSPNLPHPILGADFWEGRYQSGTTRWDIGQPAPPLISLLQSDQAPKPGRLIALGCGRGHDALWFAANGFEVVGIDFAPSAIATCKDAAAASGLPATFRQQDMFELADLAGQFDYVLEHTCFCAIAPEQRQAYVQVVNSLLRPGGEFIGLFWAHQRPGGPPYGASLTEIRDLFRPYFAVHHLKPVFNSVPARRDEEYLARFLQYQTQ